MLVDCPHCYARVVPKADGCCPACQQNLRLVTGTESMRVSLRVAQGDILPAICCDCGEPTERVTKVQASRSERREGTNWIEVIVLGLMSWLVAVYLILRGISETNVIEVRIPQCELCAAGGPPKPEYVDFGNARMTFVVHRKLRDATGE